MYLVDEGGVAEYKALQTAQIIADRTLPMLTAGMNNREKWRFYILSRGKAQ
jgi:hypothetical protein